MSLSVVCCEPWADSAMLHNRLTALAPAPAESCTQLHTHSFSWPYICSYCRMLCYNSEQSLQLHTLGLCTICHVHGLCTWVHTTLRTCSCMCPCSCNNVSQHNRVCVCTHMPKHAANLCTMLHHCVLALAIVPLCPSSAELHAEAVQLHVVDD